MIAIKHFRECIVRPALDQLQLYSLEREELLVMTCAQESLGGTYLMQNDMQGNPKGPALGVYQMEPATYNDLFDSWLGYRTMWWARLVGGQLHKPDISQLIYDMRYATKVAALQYYRFPEAIPLDVYGQAAYYKKYWNTPAGKATIPEVLFNYERFNCKR